MPTARFQPSFAAGVLGPGLHGRIDIAKYDVALKVGKNVFVHAHGGVSNRAGTEFIGEVMDSAKVHTLIPFTRDDDENYIMLMGDTVMKIIEAGAFVQDGGSDYAPATPFTSAALPLLDYVQSIDVMFFASHLHFPQRMQRTGATSWTFGNLPIDPVIAAPTSVSVTPANTAAETFTYKVSPVTGGVEGFTAAEVTITNGTALSGDGEQNVIAWSGSADEYNVYRERNGVFGYIGFTEDTEFTDDNISADLQTTPIVAADLFNTANDYPAHVTLFQQRLCFANTINQPETVFMSRTGSFVNFTKSRITRATDRIEQDLSGQQVNRINSMLQLRELLVFSSAGEFSITSPNGGMSATNPVQTQYGYSGAAKIRPLVVEDTALFVDRTGRSVRDLRYAFEQDGYSGNDLTIFASHFFDGRQIKGWCYAKSPYSVIWAYLDNGKLLSFTYKREHQVWAWCEHDIGGEVESIASIPEGTEDAVYMIVKRTINDVVKRYVERIHSREFDIDAPEDCFFVDCGITYLGAATTSISGLDHLEGETLVALADGDVVPGLVVSSGSVTLPSAATKVHIGYGYSSEIENLPPAIDLQDAGSARGRPIKANKLFLQLEKTRGIEASTSGRSKFAKFTQTAVDLALSIPLFTGMISIQLYPDWNKDGTIVVRQTFPLPMTVLGISPELTIGR
jgi:hypothetical protein